VTFPSAEPPPAPAGTDALAPIQAGVARALAEPLAALAAAFAANAEVLRRTQETTADLGKALQRADRSEALVQSTGALNETFRGLTQVQRSLAQRIDATEKAASSGRWFLPLVVLAAVVVVAVGLGIVIQYVDRWRDEAAIPQDVATQLAEQYGKGLEQGRAEVRSSLQPALDDERARGAERVRRLEDDLRAAQGERDARKADLDKATAGLEAMRLEVAATRVDALKAKAFEDEVARLRAEASLKDPTIERLQRELAEEKATNASLRQKVADVGLGRVPAPPPEGETPTPPDPAAAAAAAAAPDATLSYDKRNRDLVRERLNALLQSSAGSRADYLQLVRVGAVGTQRIVDVMAVRYAPGGRLQSTIRAKELKILADRLRRTVEFQFAEGTLDVGGSSVPLPGGTLSIVVAEGDAVPSWTGSGLTVVGSK
jgi:hypothetical protein